MGSLPLEFRPGTDVGQGATNFLLLAEVVEKASGMPYYDFVRKYQIDLLGLYRASGVYLLISFPTGKNIRHLLRCRISSYER